MATAVVPKKITCTAAAEALGCREPYVRGLIRDGVLPATRIGRRWLIDPADLRAVIETPGVGTGGRSGAPELPPPSPSGPEVDPEWLADTLAKFTPDDLRRAGEVLRSVADRLAAVEAEGVSA